MPGNAQTFLFLSLTVRACFQKYETRKFGQVQWRNSDLLGNFPKNIYWESWNNFPKLSSFFFQKYALILQSRICLMYQSYSNSFNFQLNLGYLRSSRYARSVNKKLFHNLLSSFWLNSRFFYARYLETHPESNPDFIVFSKNKLPLSLPWQLSQLQTQLEKSGLHCGNKPHISSDNSVLNS